MAVGQNRAKLDKVSPEHKPLFQDDSTLLALSNNELALVVAKRIATFEAEEAKRKAAELEREKREKEQADAEEKRKQEVADNIVETLAQQIDDEVKAEQSQGGTQQKQDSEKHVVITGSGVSMVGKPPQKVRLEKFTIAIEVVGIESDAKEAGRIIDGAVQNLDCVKSIRLSKVKEAA
jgi:hypothetical protein